MTLVRALCIVVLMAATAGMAKAQSVGYVLNSLDGTVTVFASAPNPLAGGIAEATLQTVKVCGSPSNAAITPDSNHVYVTCSADNSLWVIDATNVSTGTLSAQAVSGTQFSAPGGIAISTLATGVSAGKTLAYIVNSQTNTVSVIDTSNNSSYDGPIQLGTPPGTSGTTVFAGLITVSPDTAKVFVTTNNPTPQLWMIDTTVKPETAIQIQVQSGGIPTAATDSIYLSVQESASHSDYYLFLASSVPTNLLPNPSVVLIDIEPGVAPGGRGSPSNALFFTAQLGTSQPNHLVSLLTGGGTSPQVVSAYTVDQANLWQASFNCTPLNGEITGSCTEVTPGTGGACDATPCAISKPISEPGTPAPPLNGLGITGVPFFNFVGADGRENIYVTDGQPNGLVQIEVDVTSSLLSDPLPSAIKTGNGAQAPEFAALNVTSAPLVFFTGTPPPTAVAIGATVNATGITMVNPQNTVTADLSFGTNNALQCNGSASPCTSGPQTAVAGVGGNTTFPASGVFTVTIQGTATNSTGQSLPTGQASKTVTVGANCTLDAANVIPAANNIAVGQAVTVQLLCIAPVGDMLSGLLNWGDGTATGPMPKMVPVATDNTATLTFSHPYAAPNTYNVTVESVSDTPASGTTVAGNSTGGPVAVTVNPLSVSVSPPQISVQVPQHTVSFSAAVQFDPSNSGVAWALSVSGGECSPAICGTLSNVTPTSVTYTAPAAVPPTPTVSLTATSNVSISYPDPTKSFTVPIKLTSSQPPSCTLTAPTAGQTALSIMATVSCTAPAGDSLTAAVNWGDGTPISTSTNTVGSNKSVNFPPFAHAYMSASNPNYSIGLTVSDSTTGLAGSVSPPSVVITVLPTPTPSPSSTTSIVQGQSVTVPVTFSGGTTEAGVTFSAFTCAVTPSGPSCTVSPTSLTLDATGKGTVQVTVTTVGPATALAIPQSEKQQDWLSASLATLPGLSIVLLGLALLPGRSGRSSAVLTLFFLISLGILGAGCGSSTQRSNLPCTNCTTAGSYKVVVMGVSQKPLLLASGTFTVVVSQ